MRYPQLSYIHHKEEIDAAIDNVLASGRYILGSQVTTFEQEFADYLGGSEQGAVTCGNGTDALIMSLLACGVEPGDFVATVSFTASATAAAICAIGATPIFVDIDESYTMDVQCLVAALKHYRGIKAIVPVHLYGYPADILYIYDLANLYNIYVVSDCCQAHGAMLHGRHVSNVGDFAAYSFYPTKNLGAFGDGGAVVCNEYWLEDIRQFRQYGWDRERVSIREQGRCSRLDELQAAVLRVKLRHLNQENNRRQEIAAIYTAELGGIDDVALLVQKPGFVSAWHQYVIRLARRDEFIAFMRQRGYELQVHYPVPCHQQPAFEEALIAPGGLPYTEVYARQIVSLPIHPFMSDRDVCRVCDLVKEFV
jgi:dTDP-4-amino-4,6-dideoxygalactose transaminase